MGCFQSHNLPSSPESSSTKILNSITLNSSRRLLYELSLFTKNSSISAFDALLFPFEGLSVNALALCFLMGNSSLFSILLSKHCSLSVMEQILQSCGISPLCYLSSKGHLEMLKIYLPLYLENPNPSYSSTKAIHTATHYGNLNIINYLTDYFQERSEIPAEFDVNSREETTGENCALIACREGHYCIVKYLFERCKANFSAVNEYKENALIIAVAGMKKKPSLAYLHIVEYLIEKVRLDITYKCEEVLVLAQDKRLVIYIEAKLKECGLNLIKSNFEKEAPTRTKRDEEVETEYFEKIFTHSFRQHTVEDSKREGDISIFSTISIVPQSYERDVCIVNLFESNSNSDKL